MKKFFLIFLFSLPIYAQVIISPYVVYMDENNKFGSMIVQNESFDPYEITISFIFGFPISDSLGNRTMKYLENPNEEYPSLNNWITAFPKKFVLNSKERQTIRLMIKPPQNVEKGTYWTRIVTSSTPTNNDTTTSDGTGVTAKLKFVLNQVTTAIYRTDSVFTDLQIENAKIIKDSTETFQLLYKINQLGNSPYYGNFNLSVTNSKGEIILEEQDYISVYYNIVRNYILPKEKFLSGNYTAKLLIKFNEKEDIPESKLVPPNDISNSFEFTIP
ncbi:MAG: hypothetical protein IPM32_17325 [Ignavibacteriae bacterium]|nr:hypothetical protein [Ignavibacteriota bacterium]